VTVDTNVKFAITIKEDLEPAPPGTPLGELLMARQDSGDCAPNRTGQITRKKGHGSVRDNTTTIFMNAQLNDS
jgi:hypothetical protein